MADPTATAPYDVVPVAIEEEMKRSYLDYAMSVIVSRALPDVVARGPDPWGQRCRGRAEIRDLLVERFARIPDMHWESHRDWADGNLGVSEWTVTGTTTSGERLNWLGCDIWEFRDGKVVKKDTYWKFVED